MVGVFDLHREGTMNRKEETKTKHLLYKIRGMMDDPSEGGLSSVPPRLRDLEDAVQAAIDSMSDEREIYIGSFDDGDRYDFFYLPNWYKNDHALVAYCNQGGRTVWNGEELLQEDGGWHEVAAGILKEYVRSKGIAPIKPERWGSGAS